MTYRNKILQAIIGSVALLVNPVFAVEENLNFSAARALRVQDFAGELTVKTGSGSGVQLKMTGPKQRIKAISTKLEGDTLVIRDVPAGSTGTTITSNGCENPKLMQIA